MFASLSARIAGIGLIVVVALASLAGLLADASIRTSQSFRWVIHSAEVIEMTEAAINDLREAESGQRGFVLTRNPAYVRSFTDRLRGSADKIGHVVALTRDNPVQHARARRIARLMADRTTLLTRPLHPDGRYDLAYARTIIASDRGRMLMEAIALRARGFLAEERLLHLNRGIAAERRLARGKSLALTGASLVALLVVIGFALLIRSIRRSLDTIMRAMTHLDIGERKARIDAAMGSREFSRLAKGYNTMVDRLELAVAEQATSEHRLQIANAELQRNGEALRARGDVIELLGGMAHRMHSARTDDELAQIIQVFVPRVLPGLRGALYTHNNSRNLLAPIAAWGGLVVDKDGFAPDQCWALRRGQGHGVAEPGSDIVCGHATPDDVYHCEPLLAGGEVIGVLHLRGRVEAESRFRLTVLTENIASALVNHRLQRSLREQTIRDPLTGLFNRRYMEEALTIEVARAVRSGAPLSLVMCDVDHFKRFNDEFGHDAGDAVLQAVAATMKRHFRDGDLVCRFGGEEFTVIAPGTTPEAMMERAELVRQAVADLNVRQNGRTLGTTSMSFGIATWNDAMARDGSTLVQTADVALYQAKRAGRNRATMSLLAA